MADTLVERLTGQATAAEVPLEVNLVMTDKSVFGDPQEAGTQEPAEVLGYGPVPAPWARHWIASMCGSDADLGADPGARAWIRRLFTGPDGTRLVDMDTKHRMFPRKLRRFINVRDLRCRTPWCDAPIRHGDHPLRASDGGKTGELNSQGLCEACNYTKEAMGWRARARQDGTVVTTTPTGHGYTSLPPRAIGSSPPTAGSPTEAHLRELLRSA